MQTKAKPARATKAKTAGQQIAAAQTASGAIKHAVAVANTSQATRDKHANKLLTQYATDAPATDSAPVEIVYRTATRDAATVAAQRTNFGQYSDRDSAYLAFFGSVMRQHNDSATLAQIHAAGTDAGAGKRRNPFYTGSAKATDAGAINRLVKAGFVTVSDNGNKLAATARAKADSRYLGTK